MRASAGWPIVDRRDSGIREDRRIHPILDSDFFGPAAGHGRDRLAHVAGDGRIPIARERRPIEKALDGGLLAGSQDDLLELLNDLLRRLAWQGAALDFETASGCVGREAG